MKKLALCIILSGLCMTNSYASDSDDINALRQELNARNAAMLEMQNTISRQDQTIRMLQGNLSDMETQISTLNENQKVLYTELESLKKANAQAPAAGGTSSVAASAISVQAGSTTAKEPEKKATAQTNAVITNEAKALYDDAYRKMAAGNFKEASAGFQELIIKHSDSALIPNAYYWMGQMKYKEKNFAKAKENFLIVTKYKDSQKRADSIYKLGLISLAQKDPERAKKFFKLVVQQYPQDTSAMFAKKELEKIK